MSVNPQKIIKIKCSWELLTLALSQGLTTSFNTYSVLFTLDQFTPRMSPVHEGSVYNGEFWDLGRHFVIESKLRSNKLLSRPKRTVFIPWWPLVKLRVTLFPVQEPPGQISPDLCSWSFGKISCSLMVKAWLQLPRPIEGRAVCNTV